MTRRLHILVTRAFLVSGCAGLISCSSFEQTRNRGSLMEFETATIPRDYHGLWATSTRSCRAAIGNKAQLNIMSNSIGTARVLGAWGYSDYADVIVELALPGAASQRIEPAYPGAVVPRGDTLFMQLSLNGQKIRVSQSGDRDDRIYHRCAAE
jgi:hypothetical protein